MTTLFNLIYRITLQTQDEDLNDAQTLPYSIYTSRNEQRLLNVPISNPLFVAVLQGRKELGSDGGLHCPQGKFLILSDHPNISIRNIPEGDTYLALLIPFQEGDFNDLPKRSRIPSEHTDHLIGDMNKSLEQCLVQFVESANWGSDTLFASRRKELLLLLHEQGYPVENMATKYPVSQRLSALFHEYQFGDLNQHEICQHLAMSDSTLRRKLKAEGTNLQSIKNQARLGYGLHLLQTSSLSVGMIAEKCGYRSASRFTESFKNQFGLTPSALRHTLGS